jgi:hypothetical protein
MTGTEFAGIFIGSTLLALGFASILATALRLRQGSLTLLTFGVWSVLYGARVLAEQPPVRAVIGGSPLVWQYVDALITYVINVPITFFVGSLLGAGWRGSIRWVAAVAIAYAVVAATIDLVTGVPGTAMRPNSWIVLGCILVGLVNIVSARGTRTPLTDPAVMAGGIILVVFVIDENLGEIVVPGVNIEPIGVLIFILCLGFAVGRSVFRTEAELVSVQRELEQARRIQESLLPRAVPRPAGLDVAVRYVPLTAVAGDLYDFVHIGPSSIGILVADVMGHGVPAALVASMVKLAFSVQIGHADDPARVLASMNQILCGQLDRSYVTAVYAVVDTTQQTVTFANAGHPPPLFHRPGETVTRVDGDHGLLLGFIPDATYTNVRLEPLSAGDRILLYSDGVLEARNGAGEFFDGDRVARWLTRIESTTAERFADIALEDLSRWGAGRRFDDDVTFVVAQVRS